MAVEVKEVKKIPAQKIKELIDEALAEAKNPESQLCFDPQGRVLVALGNPFDEKQSEQNEEKTLPSESYRIPLLAAAPRNYGGLDEAESKEAKHTVVSLDVDLSPALKDKFKQELKTALNQIPTWRRVENQVKEAQHDFLVEALMAQPRGSIIALQQEFYFHLALTARVLGKIFKENPIAANPSYFLQVAHSAAMQEVNALVMTAYAKALKKATTFDYGDPNDASNNQNPAIIDIKKLNKLLDDAREEIAPKAHAILAQKIRAQGIHLTKSNLEKAKKIAEATTSTSADVLHTDSTLGLATLISGSDQTAHNRRTGEQFADREIATYGLHAPEAKHGEAANEEVTVVENKNPRRRIRTASLAPLKLEKNAAGNAGWAAIRKPSLREKLAAIPGVSWLIIAVVTLLIAVLSIFSFGAAPVIGPAVFAFLKTLLTASGLLGLQIGLPILGVGIVGYVAYKGVPKGLLVDSVAIFDIAEKLKIAREKYQVEEANDDGGAALQNDLPNRFFVYHLLTAFNDAGDEFLGKNRQTEGLRRILQGVHRHNEMEQIQATVAGGSKPTYCFLQAISVNGFGDTLGYTGDPLQDEVTWMADMALLHTLYETLPEENKIEFKQHVLTPYTNYLKAEGGRPTPFFMDGEAGESTKDHIANLKAALSNLPALRENHLEGENEDDEVAQEKSFVDYARYGLARIVANDLHFSHEYAKLTQTLSTFLNDFSVGGCKSGNERTQAINGRVAILEAILNWNAQAQGKMPQALLAVKTMLEQLGNGVDLTINKALDTQNHANALDEALDKAYNEFGLQSASSLVSLLDQGATSKILPKIVTFFARLATVLKKTKNKLALLGLVAGLIIGAINIIAPAIISGGIILTIAMAVLAVLSFAYLVYNHRKLKSDRNRAESPNLSNLSQKHAGEMQAHKGLSHYMQAAARWSWRSLSVIGGSLLLIAGATAVALLGFGVGASLGALTGAIMCASAGVFALGLGRFIANRQGGSVAKQTGLLTVWAGSAAVGVAAVMTSAVSVATLGVGLPIMLFAATALSMAALYLINRPVPVPKSVGADPGLDGDRGCCSCLMGGNPKWGRMRSDSAAASYAEAEAEASYQRLDGDQEAIRLGQISPIKGGGNRQS